MDRRTLLQGLLAVPVVSAFERNSPRVDSAPKDNSAKLRVVLGGAFTVVLQRDRGFGVRVFAPRDPQSGHALNVLADKLDHSFPQEERSRNFTLSANGLKNTMGRRPEIDPALCDFTVTTDKWCQEKYWVTIDLPAPQRIGFMGPFTPVVFGDPQKEGCMPPNHVLEYDVVDPRLVRMEEQGSQGLQPAACEQLRQRYEEGCAKLEKENPNQSKEHEKEREDEGSKRNNGREEGSAHGMCKGKEAYDSFCRHGDLTFFFGIGLGEMRPNADHLIRFFNERILESFPKLNLKIHLLKHPGDSCKHACGGPSNPGESVLRETMPAGHFIEAASVPDCGIVGPIVIFP